MIRLTALSKRYGSFTAVNGIDLSVPRGELFGFLGPNGAGKTTTLRMIAGILRPTAGRIEIAGIDIVVDPSAAKAIKNRRLMLNRDKKPIPVAELKKRYEELCQLREQVHIAESRKQLPQDSADNGGS